MGSELCFVAWQSVAKAMADQLQCARILSDFIGRRKVLFMALLGGVVGSALQGVAIAHLGWTLSVRDAAHASITPWPFRVAN